MNRFAEDRREALQRVAWWYERNRFGIRLNDGHLRSHPLDSLGRHLHPQLTVTEGETLVRFVEVETAATLDDLAPLRWRPFVGGTVPLHVYVPFDSYPRAWDLCSKSGLKGLDIVTYDVGSVADLIASWDFPERTYERA